MIIATCLHPKFKLNWLAGEKRKCAESYLENLLGIRSTENSPKAQQKSDHDDFFSFEGQGTTHEQQ